VSPAYGFGSDDGQTILPPVWPDANALLSRHTFVIAKRTEPLPFSALSSDVLFDNPSDLASGFPRIELAQPVILLSTTLPERKSVSGSILMAQLLVQWQEYSGSERTDAAPLTDCPRRGAP
jgi:hypothetical protein